MINTNKDVRFERRFSNIINVLKVKKRKRGKAGMVVVLLVSLVIFMTVTTSSFGAQTIKYTSVTVEKGDTLWDIATANPNGRNINERIYDIKKINNIESASDLRAGMELSIPV